MKAITDSPFAVFVISLLVLWASTKVGMMGNRKAAIDADARKDFSVVLTATLTLLALIIGFSFSMAVNRYDQRKNLEEAEANAIGTEYLRADLLTTEAAAKVRALLKSYLGQRIQFHSISDGPSLAAINVRTAALQAELWVAVTDAGSVQPTPLTAIAVSGMNDVLNSQGYTQAARWNRIPPAVWILMGVIASCGTALVGYGARNDKTGKSLLMVLPFVVSMSFFLIAEIDSPMGGIIRVAPENLQSLAASLRAP